MLKPISCWTWPTMLRKFRRNKYLQWTTLSRFVLFKLEDTLIIRFKASPHILSHWQVDIYKRPVAYLTCNEKLFNLNLIGHLFQGNFPISTTVSNVIGIMLSYLAHCHNDILLLHNQSKSVCPFLNINLFDCLSRYCLYLHNLFCFIICFIVLDTT